MKNLLAATVLLFSIGLASRPANADYPPYRYKTNPNVNVVVLNQNGASCGCRGRIEYTPYRYKRVSQYAIEPRGVAAGVWHGGISEVPFKSLPPRYNTSP